jgi:hypothetical protein
MKPLSPKVWAERIERSKKAQEPVRKEAYQFLRAYQGDYSANGKRTKRNYKDEMNVNAVYAMVELVIPSVYTGNPRVVAEPKRLEFESRAKLYQGVINYWLQELGAADEFGRAIFDSFFGYACIETGWQYETMQMEDGSIRVLKDQPFLKWRNPFDVLLDPDVPRRKDGRFQIIRDIVTYQYFLGMPDIPMELKRLVKPTHRPDDELRRESEESDIRELQTDSEWVELYWIWCRETEKRYLYSPQLKDRYLIDKPWPYYVEYKDDPFPVTILDGKTDCNSPYTFSEIRPLWDHIVERNRLRTAFNIHMKRSLPKYVYSKRTGTRSQISKFFNSRSDEATELNEPEGLKIAPVAEMPPELYNWDRLLEEDFLNVSSLSEYRNEALADTATEASIIEGRSTIRKGYKRKQIEDFIVRASAKLGMLCQQFMDVQQAIAIEGPKGREWFNLSKQDIEGEYNYDIEPGIMEPKNEALHRQQILKYAEIMAANPHVNQRNLALEITKKGFGLSAEKLLLSEEEVQANQAAAQEKDVTKIKDLDITQIPSPELQAKIAMKAAENSGVTVDEPQSAMNPPQDQMADMGGMDSMPVEPVGGQLGLEPVDGQQMIQPASEAPPQF